MILFKNANTITQLILNNLLWLFQLQTIISSMLINDSTKEASSYNFSGINSCTDNFYSNQVTRSNSQSLKTIWVNKNYWLKSWFAYLFFRNVTRRHGVWLKFKISGNELRNGLGILLKYAVNVLSYVIWNKNVQWTHFSKKSHFVDCHHDSVDNFVFEWLQDYSPILDSEFNRTSPRTVLNHSMTRSFMPQNSNDIAVSACAMTFNLSQQGLLQ